MKPTPPKYILSFFRWFCHPDLVQYIEGDLIELFEERITESRLRKAKWFFAWEVLKLFRPNIIRPAGGTYRLNNYGMLKNYFKVAYRNLLKNKAFGFVNILGLVIAFAAVIVIFQHIDFESNFDSFHDNKDRIYRVEMETFHEGVSQSKRATTFSAVGPDMTQEVSGIENYARVFRQDGLLMISGSKTADSKSYKIPSMVYVEKSFLSMFTFGDIDPKALDEPNSIVLTKSIAEKFFGDENPIGRAISSLKYAGDFGSLLVTGVIEDVPENSHLDFEVLVSYSTLMAEQHFFEYSWNWARAYTYLLLESGLDPNSVIAQFPNIVGKHLGEEMKAKNMNYQFDLKAIEDIHLKSNLQNELTVNGNIRSIYFLYVAAFLIMAISWLNSINLTNVRNSMRFKEVGIRKVLGAHKKQIFIQLFIESFLTNIIAMSFAILLVMTMKNIIGPHLGVSIVQDDLLRPLVYGTALFIILVGSLISAIDLSLLKSAFGKSRTSSILVTRNSSIRKSGIVFQFAISLVMIIVTLTVRAQLDFINSYDLGIDKEYSIVLDASGRPGQQSIIYESTQLFKTAMKQQSWLKFISACNNIPGMEPSWISGVYVEGSASNTGKDVSMFTADENFLKTLGLNVKFGRDFRHHQLGYGINATTHVILNLSAVKLFGFDSGEEAIEKVLVYGRRKYTVAGVIDDYHQESLRKEVDPLLIWNMKYAKNYFVLNLDQGSISEQLGIIEQEWDNLYPTTPFDFFFFDDHLDQLYQSELEFARLFTVFSSISILIALMGMFSLSSFYAVKRTKEVGIRKVLGAGIMELTWLLSSQFLLLTIIGLLIAIPIAHYTTGIWLEDFAYRVTPNWWWYVASGISVLLIAYLTISIQTFRAATVNPVECLRDE